MSKRSFIGVRPRGEIVLPADLRRRHRLDQPGAQVEVSEREDGVIELRAQLPVPSGQAWFWTPEWQAGEQHVDQHVASGELTVSSDVDDFIKDLDALRRPQRPPRRR